MDYKVGDIMSKLVIESSNKHDSPVDIEDKLEKAYTSIQLQRERKEFRDVFLKSKKDKADGVIASLFNNMIEEISEVLKGNSES